MPEPNDSPKPPSSDQPNQYSSGEDKAPKIDIGGWLTVEKEEPRKYTFKISFFNGPNKELGDLPLVEPLGEVKIKYTPDCGQQEVRYPIRLCRDHDRLSTVIFKDNFQDISWKNSLDVQIQFDKGMIRYASGTGVQTNDVQVERTLKIKDKPANVLGGTYEL